MHRLTREEQAPRKARRDDDEEDETNTAGWAGRKERRNFLPPAVYKGLGPAP